MRGEKSAGVSPHGKIWDHKKTSEFPSIIFAIWRDGSRWYSPWGSKGSLHIWMLYTNWVISNHSHYNILLAVEEIPSHPHLIVCVSSKGLQPHKQWIQHPAQLSTGSSSVPRLWPFPLTSNNSFPPPYQAFPFLPLC